MNIKAVVLSAIALVGTASLLWVGYTGSEGEHEREEHEAEEEQYHEHAEGRYTTGEYDQVRSLQQRGDILSLEQILASVRQYHEGRVLNTELEEDSDGYIYEIELVDENGMVWEMSIDARTGALLEDEQED